MKTFLVTVVLFIAANALTDEQIESIVSQNSKIGEACVEKVKATPEDLAGLIAFKIPPPTQTAKCLIACFYDHYKIMTPDGDFDKNAVIKAFEKVKSLDPAVYGKIQQLGEKCLGNKKIVADRCETASLMATCVKNEAEALGILREAFLLSE